MAGNNNHSSILLVDRDLHLLRELEIPKFLDREMAQAVCGFPSVNRANDRLLRLHRAGLLRRHFVGTEAGGRKALYSLSAKSAAIVLPASRWRFQRPENTLLVGDSFVEHQSAINWIWIAAKYRALPNAEFQHWMNFPKPISESTALVPDGYFELKTAGGIQSIFLEADLGTETSKVWERKTALYIKLATSGEFTRILQQPRFKVAVVATSELRLRNLRRIVGKHISKIFFFNTLDTIRRDGLLAPSWLRPEGDARQSLA
jgi:hypothetical protein